MNHRIMGISTEVNHQASIAIVPEVVLSNQNLLTSASSSVLLGSQEEPRAPVRRSRAPLKPGLTAKGEIRHFVRHQYHDHANDPVEIESSLESSPLDSFPIKLFKMLSEVEILGMSDIVSWYPHGRAFGIHKRKTFAEHIMPKYFSQTKLTSFQRQLNLYGFIRLSKGPDHGGYYHEMFLKGKLFLTTKICRTRVKGTKFKATSSPESEPDFYTMPFVNEVIVISDSPPVLSLPSAARPYEKNSGKIPNASKSKSVRVTPSSVGSSLYGKESANPHIHSSFISSSSEPNLVHIPPSMDDCHRYFGGENNCFGETMDALFPPLPELPDGYFQNVTLTNPMATDIFTDEKSLSGILESRQDLYYDYGNNPLIRPTETYLPTNLLPYSFAQHPMTTHASDWDNFQRLLALAYGRPYIGFTRPSQSFELAELGPTNEEPTDELFTTLIRDDFMI